MAYYLGVDSTTGIPKSGVWNTDDASILATDGSQGDIMIQTTATSGGYDWTYNSTTQNWVAPTVSIDKLREMRNEMLRESDWTHISDSALTSAKKGKWATYRQELRNITNGYTAIHNPIWPVKPE